MEQTKKAKRRAERRQGERLQAGFDLGTEAAIAAVLELDRLRTTSTAGEMLRYIGAMANLDG